MLCLPFTVLAVFRFQPIVFSSGLMLRAFLSSWFAKGLFATMIVDGSSLKLGVQTLRKWGHTIQVETWIEYTSHTMDG